MLIIADRHIPYLEVLTTVGTLQVLEPEAITAESVRDADALIVRTRTRVDRSLLEGSSVRFVATATIGYDHIDTSYCDQAGVKWTACPGCNAQAVCDYVEEATRVYVSQCPAHPISIGIVGIGHVGSLVAKMAEAKGYKVLINDTPKGLGVSLDTIAGCDIISFHTPLTKDGTWPTYHLCDASFLSLCRPDTLIINAARGGVVDEKALLASGLPCVIDCWENEPHINHQLLMSPRTHLASYHIAGYSQQGKHNASQMCIDALCHYFHLPEIALPQDQPATGDSQLGWISRITEQLRCHPDDFEQLRSHYKLR